jgi:plastocyanin
VQSCLFTQRSRCSAGRAPLALALVLYLAGAARAGELVGQVTAGGRPVREAVVYVDEIRTGPTARHARMEQKNRTFIPHVLAVQLGTRVDFPNDDTVFHNVFSFREGKRFDLGLYPVGTTRPVSFDRPGLVRIFCNIHSNMSAFIWVLENPYFAVTDRSGRFRIPNVPAGERVVRVWHEKLGTRRLSVHVPRDGEAPLEVKLDAH